MEVFFSTVLDFLTYAATGALASYIYFYRKRRDLLGGFWGGAVIGVVGAVILTYFSGTWFIELITWMMKSKKIFGGDQGGVQLRVNLIAAVAGAFLFVYILNRINHDRRRP